MTQPDTDLERVLRALEESHLRPEVRASPESLRALLADEFVEIGSSGRVLDRAAVIASLSGDAPFQSRVDDFVYPARLGVRGPFWYERYEGPELVLFGHLVQARPLVVARGGSRRRILANGHVCFTPERWVIGLSYFVDS